MQHSAIYQQQQQNLPHDSNMSDPQQVYPQPQGNVNGMQGPYSQAPGGGAHGNYHTQHQSQVSYNQNNGTNYSSQTTNTMYQAPQTNGMVVHDYNHGFRGGSGKGSRDSSPSQSRYSPGYHSQDNMQRKKSSKSKYNKGRDHSSHRYSESSSRYH